MRPCRACGLEHSPMLRCEVARRAALAYPTDAPAPVEREDDALPSMLGATHVTDEPLQLSAAWVEVPPPTVDAPDTSQALPETLPNSLNATVNVVEERIVVPEPSAARPKAHKPERTERQIAKDKADHDARVTRQAAALVRAEDTKAKRNAYMRGYMATRRAAKQAQAVAVAGAQVNRGER